MALFTNPHLVHPHLATQCIPLYAPIAAAGFGGYPPQVAMLN